VITCGQELKQSTLDLLNRLDVAPRQVEITARIFEVSQDFDFQQGANLMLNRLASDGTQSALSTFSAKRFAEAAAAGATGPVNGSVLHLMQTFSDAGLSVDVTFQLLQETGLIKVVSSPRMTVAVGQTGYMLAGQEIPIQSANLVSNVVQTTTTYKPVGVQLYITPQAISNNTVKLHTISIVSAVNGFAPLPTLSGGTSAASELGTFVNPILDSREAETQVTIHDGDTLVISGLRMVRATTREEKIPGLGELPGLGWLFKNHRTQQQMTDLYFFVTPTLL
jgi:general secretion pathway protein D